MKSFPFVLFLFLLSGCDLPQKGIIDASIPPFISKAAVSPDLIDVNRLASQPKDPIDTVVQFVVSASNVDKTTQVSYSLLDPNGNPLLAGAMLYSVAPTGPGNGIYTAAIHLHILKEDVGVYGVQFEATATSGDRSNTMLASLVVQNSNDHPPHISNLTMPDTVIVPPPGDTTFVRITLAVSDSEGLGDIVSVILSSQKPDSSSAGQFNLYDDGGSVLYVQFGGPLASGDSVAGDGIYTITIPLTKAPAAPETLPTYRVFSFKATDRTGYSSNVITKRIYIVQ